MLRSLLRQTFDRLRGDTPLQVMIDRGLVVGENLHLGPGYVFDPATCHLISIGNDVTFAPGVYVLAHDASIKQHLGYSRIAPVSIGDRVFIGARAVILPGVTIGDDAIVGAGSVVTREIAAGSIVAGSPARVVGRTDEFLSRHRAQMADAVLWDSSWREPGSCPPPETQEAQRQALRSGKACYVE